MKEPFDGLIKDRTSLVSIEPTALSKNSTTVILKNKTIDKDTDDLRGTYLGDVFKALPHGIINKTETGIGATTLELKAPRNSIIVQPLKVTASSKAMKHRAFYVGSTTVFHKNRASKEDIQNYLSDSTRYPKKFVVVADSFPRLLKEIGETAYSEYFLLIDEVNSFQNDSTFRSSMEKCIDYYKKFDKDKRALTTATMMAFSDPDILSEPETIFKYELREEKQLTVILTDEIEGLCYDEVLKIVVKTSDKILIAYNDVSGCHNIAENLIKNTPSLSKDIAILCGNTQDNRKKVGKDIFHELNSDVLPKKVNFITSAYFSGFDLKDKYHLIMLSNSKLEYSRLSVKNVIQISGRCRDKDGLLSNRLICKLPSKISIVEEFTVQELLDGAEAELIAIQCVESNFEKFPVFASRLVSLRQNLTKSYGNEFFKYIRRNIFQVYVKSFFNIDDAIESTKTKNLYNDINSLKDELTKFGFNTKLKGVLSPSRLTNYKLKVSSNKEIADKAIKNIGSGIPVEVLLDGNKSGTLTYDIYMLYINYRLLLEKDSILSSINDSFKTSKTKSVIRKASDAPNLLRFKKLDAAFDFFCKKDSDPYKRQVLHHFPIGSVFTRDEKLIA